MGTKTHETSIKEKKMGNRQELKEQLKEYLFTFMIETECEWGDENVPEQARAIFTSLCFLGSIDADTAECDRILYDLYSQSAIEDLIEFDAFDLFMCSLIC